MGISERTKRVVRPPVGVNFQRSCGGFTKNIGNTYTQGGITVIICNRKRIKVPCEISNLLCSSVVALGSRQTCSSCINSLYCSYTSRKCKTPSTCSCATDTIKYWISAINGIKFRGTRITFKQTGLSLRNSTTTRVWNGCRSTITRKSTINSLYVKGSGSSSRRSNSKNWELTWANSWLSNSNVNNSVIISIRANDISVTVYC
mmetsp:Transcript_7250/g.11126  ORF Transcript_7250/g.11126 Transcript_7250/m.11126 type:complete len:203 (-) Transcript_7250:6039-6647(-)